METRTIMIANTKTQTRHSIETSATTLGELQDQMAAMGIDFTGMAFTEGISKTQLLTRDSALPTNVMYKGQPTNNLVMLLTNPSKKIESGASRKDLYLMIKEYGLQDEIKEKYGKNFTMVGNAELEEVVSAALKKEEEEAQEAENSYDDVLEEECSSVECSHPEIVNWLGKTIMGMVKDEIIYVDDIAALNELLPTYMEALTVNKPEITDDDINQMLRDL
jgi:hypothetical protein